MKKDNSEPSYKDFVNNLKELANDADFIPVNVKELTEIPGIEPKENPSTKKEPSFNFKSSYNALELYQLKTINIPKLVNPFLQKSGLAALVGTSDTGKSTFLRQLALSIALKKEKFLGFKISATHNKAIYVSTEDDYNSISFSIRKQISQFKDIDLKNLENLEFIFEHENLIKTLESKLSKHSVDLIVVDAFSDVFNKEINANTQVRTFLNQYSNLAHKYGCLIIFLHHIGKRTQNSTPTKDSIIGSQGFEAKMRVVLELRPNTHKTNLIDLWVLKSNFLESKYKVESNILELDSNLTFKNTNLKSKKTSGNKSSNPELIKKIMELHNSNKSTRKIEEILKGTELEAGKTTINNIINRNKV